MKVFLGKTDADIDAVQLSQLWDAVGGRALQQQLLCCIMVDENPKLSKTAFGGFEAPPKGAFC